MSNWVHRRRVGVFRGGENHSFARSMEAGGSVVASLKSRDDIELFDIQLSPQGEWLLWGVSTNPASVLPNLDYAFVTLHDAYGEGGQIQRMMEQYGVRYAGTKPLSSALAYHKVFSKDTLRNHLGIKTAPHLHVKSADRDFHKLERVLASLFSPAYIVKPVRGSGAVDFFYAEDNNSLRNVLDEIFERYDEVLVEQFIPGSDASCYLVRDFRDNESYTTPVVEVTASGKHLAPATFDRNVKDEIEAITKDVHDVLGLGHISKSDFRVTPEGNVYFLEVNTVPDLSANSSLVASLQSVGAEYTELLDHLLNTKC